MILDENNSPRGKVIGIHHRLDSLAGHRYTEAVASREAYALLNREVVLLISRIAPSEIAHSLGAEAVFDDPTFQLQWTFEERTRRFVEQLHSFVTPIVHAEDRIFLTVATQLEANALGHWLRELSPQKKPWIIVVFLSDRWNRAGIEEYERQMAEFGILKKELGLLSDFEKEKLLLFSVCERLGEELSALLGSQVGNVPMPLRYEDGLEGDFPQTARPAKRIAVMGGMRREKCSNLLPQIVAQAAALEDVHFVIQGKNEGLNGEEWSEILRLENSPRVSLYPHEMGLREYAELLQSCDLVLLPYQVIPYRNRTSGVLGEAVAYAKPAIVPTGTWLANEIQVGRASGLICEQLDSVGYVECIQSALQQLPELRRRACAVSQDWRESVSFQRFIEIIEGEIERRRHA